MGWGHIGGTVGVGVGMGGLGNQGPGLRLLTCGLVEGLGVKELGDLGLGMGGVVEPGRGSEVRGLALGKRSRTPKVAREGGRREKGAFGAWGEKVGQLWAGRNQKIGSQQVPQVAHQSHPCACRTKSIPKKNRHLHAVSAHARGLGYGVPGVAMHMGMSHQKYTEKK